MPEFDFAQPTSLNEALELFAADGEVRALVGGTDIVDQLKTGRRNADMVVDVKRIPELQRLELTDDGLHIGAARNLTDIAEFPAVLLTNGTFDRPIVAATGEVQFADFGGRNSLTLLSIAMVQFLPTRG